MPDYDLTKPWNEGVRGTQALPLINTDAPIIRVEAGPGTGKTFGLVQRVVRLLHPEGLNEPATDVLVVAFNRVIAKDLAAAIKVRLAAMPHTGTPEIRTVHALCLRVIGGDLRLLMDHEREAMIYDILAGHAAIKSRLRSARKVEQALENHEARHQDDPELWAAVFRWLTRHQAHLLSQLPRFLLDGLRQGDYAGLTYKHVLVDEFQDLTPGEQELFYKLRKPDGQLVALGDPRQSIYAFRGNEREGLTKLSSIAAAVGEVVVNVPLPECQRCPAAIVQAANRLMTLYPPPMVGGSGETANLHVVTWSSPHAEATGMAAAIRASIRARPNDRHLAMVTRRKFGYWLRDELKRLDPQLKVDLGFSESLLDCWPVREAFLFVSSMFAPDAATWRAWFGYQSPTRTRDFRAISRNADAYLAFLTDSADQITEQKVVALANSGQRPRGRGGKNMLERAIRFRNVRATFGELPADAPTTLNQLFSPT